MKDKIDAPDWHKRFRRYKKTLNRDNADIAEITGHTASSVKTLTQPKKKFPRWLKLVIVDFEKHRL